MQVIFCSNMFSDVEKDIKNSRHPNSVSGHKFQENLLRGLLQNNVDISVLNLSRIRAYPDYDRIFFSESPFVINSIVTGQTISFINLPIVNRLTQMMSLYFGLKKKINKNEQCIILIWNSNVVTMLPTVWIKKEYSNVVICDCIGDIYGQYGALSFSQDVQLQSLKRKVLEYFSGLYKNCDCFVYLTKYMREVLDLYDKPYCIVEALYTVQNSKTCQTINSADMGHKGIFYAGTVSMEYGMEHLLNAFSLIHDDTFRLQIAGSGDGENFIREYCMKDSRISYLGVISPSEVARYQAKATVLVSPRKSTEPFVKYSFPSKTVECLASGTPYVAHRLPCEPSEYADYIQYPDDESDEALAHKLEEVCYLPEEERRRIGERGRRFIENEKNPKVMCKRIVDMWRGMLGE